MNNRDSEQRRPRWRWLLLAAVIFVVAAALLAGLWQLPHLFPQLAAAPTTPATAVATPTRAPVATRAATPAPSATPSPTPRAQLEIARMQARTNDISQTVTLSMTAFAPAGQGIAEALLWYDTQAGHQLRRFSGPLPPETTLTYTIQAAQEGLTTTLPAGELDYWWQVRDTAGATVRAGDTVTLTAALQALVATPTPEPPPVDFTWAVSESKHFNFAYVPGTEAGRDLPRLARLAEASLSYITPTLQITPSTQITVYLTPRVFWQGGAAYGNHTILISYLDRNYTGVEMWSYFTHEATHALAGQLVQPKQEGGPDGVLVEGFAVWASGGHYRSEPVDAYAAVIAASSEYVPLARLRAGPFYDFQHETAYMEAASFDKYLIDHFGLPAFKQLYGRATGKADSDEALVKELYGKGYDALEQDWLAYLRGLSPTPQQVETWNLQVQTFDLMRRYETAFDPGARILPNGPTEWQSDTLKIFTRRVDAPINLELETALIAAEVRMDQGDLAGARAQLASLQAVLDTSGTLANGGPSFQVRQEIVDALAAQDRAVRLADAAAYRATLDPAYARSLGLDALLQPPYVRYWQELVRLDIADDGQSATGMVQLHVQVAGAVVEGSESAGSPDDGRLFAVRWVRSGDRWLVAGREPAEAQLNLPPPR